MDQEHIHVNSSDGARLTPVTSNVLANASFSRALDVSHSPEQQLLIDIVESVLDDASLKEQVEAIVTKRQAEGLILTDLSSGKESTIDISLVPVYLSEQLESKLASLVSDLSIAKGAVVEAAATNIDLQNYLFEGLEDITREILTESLGPIPDHFRLRYDTFSDLGGSYSRQIELNGGEPQGDIIMSKVVEVTRDIVSLYFKSKGLSEERIDSVFENLKPPAEQCASGAYAAYRKFAEQVQDLPERANIGIFAFRDPKTKEPRSSLSNAEAHQSEAYYVGEDRFASSTAFDPFDIKRFEEVTAEDGQKFLLPVISMPGEESERTIHFIRRLHGEPMENIDLWKELKESRPEIYYPFIGKQHAQFNPEGLKIPAELQMNPLNSLLTDKKLDALLTDARLIERFRIQGAVTKTLLEHGHEQNAAEAFAQAEQLLERTAEHISKTRALRRFQDGLYSGDTDFQGTLGEAEIDEIKANRGKYVLKLGTLNGHSGTGVFVGPAIDVGEVPDAVLEYLDDAGRGALEAFCSMHEIKISDGAAALRQLEEKLQNPPEARSYLQDTVWKAVVEYALDSDQAIIQECAKSQKGPVIFASTNTEDGLLVKEREQYNLDLNPQAFFDKMSYVLIRASKSSKANITGGYGCLASNFPYSVSKEIIKLYAEVNGQA